MVKPDIAVSIEFGERCYIGDLPQGDACVAVGDERSRVVWFFAQQPPAKAVREKTSGQLQVSDRQPDMIHALRQNSVLSRFAHVHKQWKKRCASKRENWRVA